MSITTDVTAFHWALCRIRNTDRKAEERSFEATMHRLFMAAVYVHGERS